MTGMAAPVSVLGRAANNQAFMELVLTFVIVDCFLVFRPAKLGIFLRPLSRPDSYMYFKMMKRLNLLAGCLVVLCVLLSSCATASFSKYKGVGRVKRYDFYSAQLPDSFDGFRVAFASDFHYESRFTARRLPGMCQALRSLDADVLLLGGDYRGRNGGDVTQLFQALKTVETPCGTYAVMGNHERGQADSLARKAMQETGYIYWSTKWIPCGEERSTFCCAAFVTRLT